MMVYNESDSNGTDNDDLPTQVIRSQGGVKKGRSGGNGKPSSAFQIDQQIRELEIDAYHALLRAFSAQSEVITWSKEELMSDLRKELRIADEQHRAMLGRFGNDEILRRIRTWRQTAKDSGMPPHADRSPSPAVFQSMKRQKVGHGAQILLPPAPNIGILPSASGGRGLSSGKKGRNNGVADALTVLRKAAPDRPGEVAGGRGTARWSNHKGAGPITDSHVEAWVGRSLRIRWPEDNIHYEALVVDYDKEDMLHRLVYDSGTPDESFEWVDLKRMGKNEVQWLDNRADPVPLDGKVLPLVPAERGRGSFRRPVGRPKGGDERRRPSISHDKPLPAPTPQSRSWKGRAPAGGTDKIARRSQILYPEVHTFVKEITALEHEKDLEKLESGRRLAKEYEEMLRKALAVVTNFSIDGWSEDDRVNVMGSPVHSVWFMKDPHRARDTGNSQVGREEDDGFSGDEGSEGNYEGADTEGASDAELDHAEDDGDGDDDIEID